MPFVAGGGPAAFPGAVTLGMGRYHMCALLTDGFVECWGYNGYGQLATGDDVNRPALNEAVGQ